MELRGLNPSRLKVTPHEIYLRRREFLRLGAAGAIGALLGAGGRSSRAAEPNEAKIEGILPGPFGTDEKETPLDDATSYSMRT